MNAFTPDEIEGLAKELNVKREEVSEMETRLSGGDIALEGQIDDGEESYAPIAYLADSHNEPTDVLASRQFDKLQSDGVVDRARIARRTQPPDRSRRAGSKWKTTARAARRCMNSLTSSACRLNGFARSKPAQ